MIYGTTCCGLRELHGVIYSDPETLIPQEFGMSGLGFGAVYFTTNDAEADSESPTTARYVKYITENKLGTVESFPPFVNPNTNRLITMTLWTIDHDAVDKKGWSKKFVRNLSGEVIKKIYEIPLGSKIRFRSDTPQQDMPYTEVEVSRSSSLDFGKYGSFKVTLFGYNPFPADYFLYAKITSKGDSEETLGDILFNRGKDTEELIKIRKIGEAHKKSLKK